ncbi:MULTISPECIES: hypothetical protein [unclassified Microcoleus]
MELEDIDRTCSLRAIDYSANPNYEKANLFLIEARRGAIEIGS